MLTILGRANSANVQKVMWAVHELGLEYDRKDLGGPHGGLDAEGYRALNPNGVIPTIIDGDTVVWESNAIIRYLAQKHDDGGISFAWRHQRSSSLQQEYAYVFYVFLTIR